MSALPPQRDEVLRALERAGAEGRLPYGPPDLALRRFFARLQHRGALEREWLEGNRNEAKMQPNRNEKGVRVDAHRNATVTRANHRVTVPKLTLCGERGLPSAPGVTRTRGQQFRKPLLEKSRTAKYSRDTGLRSTEEDTAPPETRPKAPLDRNATVTRDRCPCGDRSAVCCSGECVDPYYPKQPPTGPADLVWPTPRDSWGTVEGDTETGTTVPNLERGRRSPTLRPGPCADCEPAFWSGVFLAAVVAFVVAALVAVAI